jgi:hypothetical protein
MSSSVGQELAAGAVGLRGSRPPEWLIFPRDAKFAEMGLSPLLVRNSATGQAPGGRSGPVSAKSSAGEDAFGELGDAQGAGAGKVIQEPGRIHRRQTTPWAVVVNAAQLMLKGVDDPVLLARHAH